MSLQYSVGWPKCELTWVFFLTPWDLVMDGKQSWTTHTYWSLFKWGNSRRRRKWTATEMSHVSFLNCPWEQEWINTCVCVCVSACVQRCASINIRAWQNRVSGGITLSGSVSAPPSSILCVKGRPGGAGRAVRAPIHHKGMTHALTYIREVKLLS